MKKFKYVASNKGGKKIKGTFVAENDIEMKETLLKAGYYVISFREVSVNGSPMVFSVSGKIKVKELSQFCNQFSIMINAGISIEESIKVASEQSFTHLLKNTLKKILEDLRQGVSLSDAMAKFPKIFPPFFTSMVFVGESAGCLGRVLVSVAEYYELEERTKKKVRNALAYPIILVVMLIGILAVLVGFVIPNFVDAFSKIGIQMPPLTMAIFNLSNFFRENILYILVFVVTLIAAIWLIGLIPSVKMFKDKLKVRMIVFRKISMAIFTSRFCRCLGLLLSSGSDTLSALENLRKTITNRHLAKEFDYVVASVKKGMTLSAALAAEMRMSEVMVQMIIVGERTGELDQILTKTAPYFDSEAENSLSLITTIIQPAIMIILGVAVAILFVAIYSPILEMITQLNV